MDQSALQKHIYTTYFRLRFCLAGLAAFLPFVLWGIGVWWKGIPLQGSMSHYYFAIAPTDSELREFPMRVLFVGTLWALGWFLILYKGFSKKEDRALNLAGVMALGVAFFPMSAGKCNNCVSWDSSKVHFLLACILFTSMAFVALFCTKESLQ
jgi:hypothetical protein